MESVSIAVGHGKMMRGALASPRVEGERPAIIVIHEIFGLNNDIRAKAQRFADAGYVALAPDVFSAFGRKPLCIFRAVQSLRAGDGPAFEYLERARQWLAERPEVDGSRIGVIGFCMGGGFALLFAAKSEVGAAAVFYGDVPKDPQLVETACPVVAGFGGRDRVFGKNGARLARHLQAAGVVNDVVTYPDAGHSYMSEHRGVVAKVNSWGPMRVGFNAAAAEDSWRRVDEFFGRYLGPEAAGGQ
ncbi:MAG TPA: dienelactone hydrolase family protein [Tepidiformaceae bacterium]|nr:dienelactone hydrolase family protein [Tepidiformaceae bacterium]